LRCFNFKLVQSLAGHVDSPLQRNRSAKSRIASLQPEKIAHRASNKLIVNWVRVEICVVSHTFAGKFSFRHQVPKSATKPRSLLIRRFRGFLASWLAGSRMPLGGNPIP
jgi:hypothetical protein